MIIINKRFTHAQSNYGNRNKPCLGAFYAIQPAETDQAYSTAPRIDPRRGKRAKGRVKKERMWEDLLNGYTEDRRLWRTQKANKYVTARQPCYDCYIVIVIQREAV